MVASIFSISWANAACFFVCHELFDFAGHYRGG
jgi:hypothetical protein